MGPGSLGPWVVGVGSCFFPLGSLCTKKDFGIHRGRGAWEPGDLSLLECEELLLVNSNIW